jgi:hypothetical protein
LHNTTFIYTLAKIIEKCQSLNRFRCELEIINATYAVDLSQALGKMSHGLGKTRGGSPEICGGSTKSQGGSAEFCRASL